MAKKITKNNKPVQAEPVGQAAADQSKLEQAALEQAELKNNGTTDQGAVPSTGEPIQGATEPANPQVTPPVAPNQNSTKKVIKKNNTKSEVKREQTQEEVATPNAGDPPSADSADRQLNTEEAVAYAMTTPNPMDTARRMAAQRKLTNVTGTYKRLEELGHK